METDLKNIKRQTKAPLADPMKADRLPPHSIGAEQGVLGCVMLAPNETLPVVLSKIKSPEFFYDLRHQVIFETVVEMHGKGEPIDLITLQQKLKDREQLEPVGGLVYLAELPDTVPSAANIEYYLEIVFEKFTLRKLIGVCTEVVSRSYSHQGELATLLDQIEADIHAVTTDAQSTDRMKTAKQLAQPTLNRIEELFANQGQIDGIPTGLYDLDNLTAGLQNGEMVVIAARPSVGKTSLAMNIAEHVCFSLSLPVGVASLEMTSEQMMLRLVSSIARVPGEAIKRGTLSESHFGKITSAMSKLNTNRLIIDDSSGTSILQLKAKARRMQQRFGIKLFIIDYLQLLHSTSKKADNRQQEVSDISSGAKQIAKELGIPVVILSQLNREMEKGGNRKPRMSDLRESGSIEQDADQIWMLYRPDDQDAGEGAQTFQVNVVVAKNRNGPTGEIPLTFMKQITRFESLQQSTP